MRGIDMMPLSAISKPDALLAGARLIDPAAGRDGLFDVALAGDRVLAVGEGLRKRWPTVPVHDLTGTIMVPGLIDMHAHVAYGLGDLCVPPDLVGVHAGVTTVVDAGSAGAGVFPLFRRAIIDPPDVETRVLALMDPCTVHMPTRGDLCGALGLDGDPRNVDAGLLVTLLDQHDDVLVGLVARHAHGAHGGAVLNVLLRAAGRRPVMAHLESRGSMEATGLLELLRPGDILTHCFRPGGGLIDDHGRAIPALVDAVGRGVRLDVGHSAQAFDFDVAHKLMDQGFLPHSASTGMTVDALDGAARSLALTLTKLWLLGVPLAEVIAMATCNAAAQLLRAHELGTLLPGRLADVSVLQPMTGDWTVEDGNNIRAADRQIVAVGCYRAGRWFAAIDAELAGAAL
jgi:dihydroorotase